MTIENCQEIEEIVGGGDDDDDKISFPQLKILKLQSLPKLESFCSSRHYTFDFLSLKWVYVDDCPNMKTFSHGELNTPFLHGIRLQWNMRWEGNLNSAIQQIFREESSMVEESENSWEESENSEEDLSDLCKKQRRHGTWEGN
ncbi:uncharacterized protein LOC128283928 [Gossypium arboreum]|nr:uncharacterized protein LOC128283928 [Gossypium arboreum]KAK5785947.1 hypothetical protein PVK06_040569 [Gossypium arboreum]